MNLTQERVQTVLDAYNAKQIYKEKIRNYENKNLDYHRSIDKYLFGSKL